MIIEAILKINPNAKVNIKGDDINTCEITWNNGTTPISKADIQAQFTAVEFDTAMEELRDKRDRLLAETDFHGASDNTMSAAMTTYRQDLRDITNGISTLAQVNAVVFPTKP